MSSIDIGASSPSQKPPHTAAKAGMNAILDAAYGLSSLASPGPCSSKETQPSTPNRSDTTKNTHPLKSEARVVTQDVPKPVVHMDSIIRDVPPLTKPVLTKPFSDLGIGMPQQPPSAPRYLEHRLPSSYPAVAGPATEIAQPFFLNNPSSWASTNHPQPPSVASVGYGSLHPAEVAMAVDCFSASQRMAMMDEAAVLARAGPVPLLARYPYGYPSNSSSFPANLDPNCENETAHDSPPNTKNFPELLYDVLSVQENAHILSWLPHGKGFIIHDKQRFVDYILPRYFDGAKFTSFTRRLKVS